MSTHSETVALRDLAVFIRSKNAGPFVLTIDIFFDGPEKCRHVIDSGVLGSEQVAALYRIAPTGIRIIHVSQANALKISIPRPLVAGDVGDRDVAGGQQFAPILDVRVPVSDPAAGRARP